MLVQISSQEKPSGVVDLLLECHGRIRSFTGLAARLAKADQVSNEEIRSAASGVVRYFSEALPLHVADEEQSIVPRLAGRSAELDSAFEQMHSEHVEHEPLLALLLEICRTLQDHPERLDELRQKLSVVASTLDAAFADHLEKEERLILPAIRTLLPPEEQDMVLTEIRARR